jgi:hypothetical protein
MLIVVDICPYLYMPRAAREIPSALKRVQLRRCFDHDSIRFATCLRE